MLKKRLLNLEKMLAEANLTALKNNDALVGLEPKNAEGKGALATAPDDSVVAIVTRLEVAATALLGRVTHTGDVIAGEHVIGQDGPSCEPAFRAAGRY